jgi:glutamate formiminotransferase/glutamate formiminotransferase/formiminotetrahydrofolate cyclodeaminase
MKPPMLLAVPNVSEGRDQEIIRAIAAAFSGDDASESAVRLLDVHTDRDHHRSVFTLAGPPRGLADALLRGARMAVERVDVISRAGGERPDTGQHPHVGAVDVAPIVYLDAADRGAACAEALVAADRFGEELEVPVFLYGELSGGDGASARTRAELRRGGVAGLAARVAGAETVPDFGPPALHPTAGATLVAARAPLVAFNLQLAAPATVDDAHAIAALIREGGREGLPGLRAIGVALEDARPPVAQVSMNVERPAELALARVLEAVRAHAPVASAELVGLAPAVAFVGFPEDLPIVGFDRSRHVIENALALASRS